MTVSLREVKLSVPGASAADSCLNLPQVHLGKCPPLTSCSRVGGLPSTKGQNQASDNKKGPFSDLPGYDRYPDFDRLFYAHSVSLNFPVSKHTTFMTLRLCPNPSLSPESLSPLSSSKFLSTQGNLLRNPKLDHLSYHVCSPFLVLWNSTYHVPLSVFSCLSPP